MSGRFVRAIDQLGGSRGKKRAIETRLGGIYGLEEYGKRSGSSRARVGPILAAYIRSNAPRSGTDVKEDLEWPSCRRGSFPPDRVAPDIAAALDVLRTLFPAQPRAPPPALDLSRADLAYADLSGLDLRHADLRRARLAGAMLLGSNLADATLERADARGACFKQRQLDAASSRRR